MKKKIISVLLAAGATIILFSFTKRKTDATIDYPDGYRHWEHVKSSIVGPASPAAPKYEGFTHIYANPLAIKGYQTGKFPDGAIIVFDVLEKISLKTGEKAGKRKFIDVMVRDSKRFENTGGWGFQEFFDSTGKTGVLTTAEQQKCFSCHATQKEREYVFSKYEQ